MINQKLFLHSTIILAVIILAVLLFLSLFYNNYDYDREKIDLKDMLSESEADLLRPMQDPNLYFFGFTICSSPQEDAEQYMPLLRYLERCTGYKMMIHFALDEGKIFDDLFQGNVHFAALESGTCLLNKEKDGLIPLVRGLNIERKPECRSAIIVGKNSSIKTIKDLKGKSFAFGNIISTSGHLIPRIIFSENDLTLKDLSDYTYTGSHYNCANAVVSEHFDAGCILYPLAYELAEKGIINIIYISKNYPSTSIVANKDVPPDLLNKIKDCLLRYKPKEKNSENFCNWDRMWLGNGFTEIHKDECAELEIWMEKLNFLKSRQ